MRSGRVEVDVEMELDGRGTLQGIFGAKIQCIFRWVGVVVGEGREGSAEILMVQAGE